MDEDEPLDEEESTNHRIYESETQDEQQSTNHRINRVGLSHLSKIPTTWKGFWQASGWVNSGRPRMEGRNTCEMCNGEKRRELGICVLCEKDVYEGSIKCIECMLKQISSNVFGTSKRWRELVYLWHKQDGCCAYTGIKMKYTEAELDHIVPVGRSGGRPIRQTDLDNLQWVLRDINRMKYDLSEEKFFNYIGLISQYRHIH